MNHYTIEEDRMGNITISHPREKRDVFLQFESDIEYVKSILTEEELCDLEDGYGVTIADVEPRASSIDELFELS